VLIWDDILFVLYIDYISFIFPSIAAWDSFGGIETLGYLERILAYSAEVKSYHNYYGPLSV